LNDLALTTAGSTRRGLATGFGAASATQVTTDASTKRNLLLNATCRFLQRQRYIAPDVGTFAGSAAATTAATTKQISKHPSAKQVTECVKDIFDVVELMNPIHTGVAMLIIALTFVPITENFVSLCGLLELLNSTLIISIAVGVKLDGKLTIRPINFYF
jgi:hypothetical protein